MILQNVIRILDEIATLLDLSSSNRFKGKSIRKAIRMLEIENPDIKELVEQKNLQDLSGIGPSIASMITEIVETGTSKYRDKLEKVIPITLAPLLKITGIKRYEILRLHQLFFIKSLEDLKLCTPEQFLEIGISEKRQERIRKSIAEYMRYGPRLLWWTANGVAHFLKEQILKGTSKCEISGEIRRSLNTVRQIDLVVDSSLDWISQRPWVLKVIKRTSTTLVFQGSFGIPVKVTVAKESFAKSLFLTTGSASHIRTFNRRFKSQVTIFENEEQIYAGAGLQYIPPELREDGSAIQYASEGRLPKLVEKRDIRGVYHCHTLDSDGTTSFEELAYAAEKLYRWEYLGISDHSKSCKIANGMPEEKLLRQMNAIREFNLQGHCSCTVLSGIECDILIDGNLDYSDEILKQLDFVIVSIHSHFGLSKALMTRRLIKAIENPYTTIIGHITGRLLLHRFGYILDMHKIIDACIANNKVIEINAQPSRLDMDWTFWHKASDRGLRCAINPDAHSIQELRFYEAGINVARKGWLTAEAVINTSSTPLKNSS